MYPFSDDKAETVSALGEVGLIERIKLRLGDATAPAPRGIGDDCAVLPAQPLPGARLVTTDSVIWARHFDESVPARSVGEKLIKRNLSDIAATGGTPADAVLSLVLGANTRTAWLDEFFAGVADCCRRFRTELAGGDIANAGAGFFCATLSLTGFSEKPLLRAGARFGDTLLATGTLGGTLLKKHFAFEPRLAEGRWLATRSEVRAGMDITDGLAKDIPAMLPAGAAAFLDSKKIPISADALAMSKTDSRSPTEHALNDGEDYELLIAADSGALPALLRDWKNNFPEIPLTPFGLIKSAPAELAGKLIAADTGKPLNAAFRGYSHF